MIVRIGSMILAILGVLLVLLGLADNKPGLVTPGVLALASALIAEAIQQHGQRSR